MGTLEERVAYLEGRMEDHIQQSADVRAAVRESRDEAGHRFDAVDGQFAQVRDELGRRFDAIDRRFETIDRRFETIDHRFEMIDHRFEMIDRRFDGIDRRFEGVDGQFAQMRSEASQHFMWVVGLQIATVLAVIGALVNLR